MLEYEEMIAHHEKQIERIKELDIYPTENDRLLAMEYHKKLIKDIKWLAARTLKKESNG